MLRHLLVLGFLSPIWSAPQCFYCIEPARTQSYVQPTFQRVVQQPVYQPQYQQMKLPMLQRQEVVESVPVETVHRQQAPGSNLEMMYSHQSSSSSSQMGYVKYNQQPVITQVQAQPIRMEPVKQQPCQYFDPCAYSTL